MDEKTLDAKINKIVEVVSKELTQALSSPHPENHPENWQAAIARQICYDLLEASNADGMSGCALCQM